ncbi:ribonuclease HII [Oxalobacter aliiformigenes]|uniref:ribonuclease HII n=1 Tax=Oxalobacter aliiformigenes TaxID=2946593 RepID=UPI0022AF2F15|nr:ribonuclease HII [Oxalobacter aliiformigenes]MCZ4064171.1 ribonuclease HII [Oxalobacter aliiformigenes]WAV99546.1 ribonuclease HII [Oxalobacter aliiformigenes]
MTDTFQDKRVSSLQLSFEDVFLSGISLVCGADEAGRGPIAGPVFAAAVILDPDHPIDGLKDSKKLSENRRDELAQLIKEKAKAWSVAQCSVAEIDELNILWASMLAMKRAIERLSIKPELALIDGNRCPKELSVRARAIVKGDDRIPVISAASILAKTARDAIMMELHSQYPEYGFDRHKGYPTAFHLAQLEKFGVSPVHRKTYAPVRKILERNGLTV